MLLCSSKFLTIFYMLIVSIIICNDSCDDYFGGWPINDKKDELQDPGYEFNCNNNSINKNIGCPCTHDSDCSSGKCFKSPRIGGYCLQNKGDRFPRYSLFDQYGEKVDIYDFANQGKFILIEFSTAWCLPCKEFASWLNNDDISITTSKIWKKEYDIIKELINQDLIYFINVQIEDQYREPASIESLEEWFQRYPDKKVALLADSNYNVRDWVRVTAYPTAILLNEKMEIVEFSIRGWYDAFDRIVNFEELTKKLEDIK